MANRTYLIVCKSPASYKDFDGESIACAASYMIPIFWYMLFKPENIVRSSTPCDGDEPDYVYDRLIANKVEAISLAKERLPVISNVIGFDPSHIFELWVSLLESIDGDYIYVETCELAMMDDDSVFSRQALNCIESFSEKAVVKKGFILKKKQINPKWAELLGQAEINNMSSIESYKLAGYSWGDKVPWE